MHSMNRIFLIAAVILLAMMVVAGGFVSWVAIKDRASSDTPSIVPKNPHSANQTRKPPPPPKQPEKPITQIVLADSLPPMTDGPALAICDPIPSGASSRTAAFGAGCTRWLQYAMFGYPQLGQMMKWSEQERAFTELGIENLRLSPSQVQKFGRIIGYTHVATSTIHGDPGHCTLTLQISEVSGNMNVGPACSVSGSEAQVIAALPQLAQQLLTRLSVQASAPSAPGLTADELSIIGSDEWWPSGHRTAELQGKMDALAKDHPLAGMLRMYHSKGTQDAYRRLFEQAPDNLAARAECVDMIGYFSLAMQYKIIRGVPSAPNNFIVALAHRDGFQTNQEFVSFAEHAVQCAPLCPYAHEGLAEIYMQTSDKLRQARTAGDISSAEFRTLDRLYSHALTEAQAATTLDPMYGRGWYETAVAATFAGQPALADAAMWKAIKYWKGSAQIYRWGLQMYQPKWFDDAAKLDKIVKLAIADKSLTPDDRYALAAILREMGRLSDAQQLEAPAN